MSILIHFRFSSNFSILVLKFDFASSLILIIQVTVTVSPNTDVFFIIEYLYIGKIIYVETHYAVYKTPLITKLIITCFCFRQV